MAQLPITKSVAAVTERLVRGGLPINTTPLLALASVPVSGLHVIRFTAALAAATNTVTRQVQEFTVTAAADKVVIAVGDLFIPFNPGIGATTGLLNDTLVLLPAVAITAHKVPVVIGNLTAAATNPDDALTLTYLWIKVA